MTTFGRYEILERLAVGGMAEVYRARAWVGGDTSKDVVIKKILPAYSADPEFRSLFVHEARISVGLTHSRITQVLDFGLMDGSYFIAMELVDGPNLGVLLAALRKEFVRMPAAAAVHVITEVLEGLEYAHRRTGGDGKPLEIVHRDISPHNVLVSRAGEVKLTDFGIARAAGSPSTTRVGRMRGKPQYMSPEQIRGEPLDGRSDLFSCGLLFYELLTGFPAFPGTDDNAVMSAILRGELEPASKRVPDVPRALDRVIAQALRLERGERFATAGDFRYAVLEVSLEQRIRPQGEVLAALVQKHVARAGGTRPAGMPSLVDRTGEDGELGRFSSTGSSHIHTADTAESERGASLAGTVTSESERGPAAAVQPPMDVSATRVVPRTPEPEIPAPASLPVRAQPVPRIAPRPMSAVPRRLLALAVGVAIVAVGYLAVPLPGTRNVPAVRVVAPGTLSLDSRPTGEVTIDGRAVGPTPIVDLTLAPGTYPVAIANAADGVSATFTVTIESGRHARRSVELR